MNYKSLLKYLSKSKNLDGVDASIPAKDLLDMLLKLEKLKQLEDKVDKLENCVIYWRGAIEQTLRLATLSEEIIVNNRRNNR